MGASQSSSKGSSSSHWEASPAGGAAQRKISDSGYDVTPLTQDELKKYSAGLTPFQKYVLIDFFECFFPSTTVKLFLLQLFIHRVARVKQAFCF